MKEYEPVPMFHGFDVYVGDARRLGGETGEFEIMGGEQRKCPHFGGDEGGAGPRERQAVEGTGAAAHFVHEHEAFVGGVVEDVRRLGHFQHERRAAPGQIVGGADAREDAVEGAEHRAFGRHETADVREDGDQRRLAHVGAFSAHVGAGDDEHAAVVIEMQIVGNERLAGLRVRRRGAALDRSVPWDRRPIPAGSSRGRPPVPRSS